MEYIGESKLASPTLDYYLQQNEFNSKKWITIIKDICDALLYMHNQGVLHKDLHLRNILLRKETLVKILDFGNATFVECFHTLGRIFVPYYGQVTCRD